MSHRTQKTELDFLKHQFDLLDIQTGGEGVYFMEVTTVHSGKDFRALQVLNNATFTVINDLNGNDLRQDMNLSVIATGTLTGTTIADTDTVTIEGKVYTFQDVLTDVDGNIAVAPLASAINTFTFDENASDTNTVTIGSQVYTFQTVLTDSADNVLIGASASDSADNLIAAIMGGAGVGTLYGTGTSINTDVTAVAGSGDTIDVIAIIAGTVSNVIATTDTITGTSAWDNVTLTGGTDDDDTSILNLIAAINLGAGSGTAYATSMTLNSDIIASSASAGVMTATSKIVGVAANSIDTTDTLTAGGWAAATLLGGGDSSIRAGALITATDRVHIGEVTMSGGDCIGIK